MRLLCALVILTASVTASLFSVATAFDIAPGDAPRGFAPSPVPGLSPALDRDLINDPSLCVPYDPDADLPTPRIILRHGYPAEKHIVKTDDGFLLEVHRIPHGKDRFRDQSKPPVLLQHGLLGSSADYVINGPEKSFAYILADLGYDVWLGNCRGNTYSKHHVRLDPKNTAFWNFSFHEMGYYDLPAVIDFILKTTGQRDLLYMGHSMGTTMFYVMAATRPEYNEKIRAQFSLAPVAFMSRAKSPVRYLAPFADDYMKMIEWIGSGEFLGHTSFMKKVTKYMCEFYMLEEIICENYIFVICGYDRDQFNRTLLPNILGHTPAGASTKTLVHYAQEIASGKFRQFDYGAEENLVKYGSIAPPEYDLSKITSPVSLYHSLNDFLANEQDVSQLQELLPNVINSHQVEYPQFNHLDFLWSIDIRKLIMDRVLNDIEKVAVFDFSPYESFFTDLTNSDGGFNTTNLIQSLLSARKNSSAAVEFDNYSANFPEEVRSDKLVQAFLINKFTAQLRRMRNGGEPDSSKMIDTGTNTDANGDIEVEYEDSRDDKSPRATMGPLQMMNWKHKAAKAVKFYDKTVRVFKKKLANYEELYHRQVEKLDKRYSDVKDSISKVGEKVSDVGQNVGKKISNVGEKISDMGQKLSEKYDSTVNKSLRNIRDKISEYETAIKERYNFEGKKQSYANFVEKMKTKAKEIETRFLNLPRKMVDTYNDIKSYVRKDSKKDELPSPGEPKLKPRRDDDESVEAVDMRKIEREEQERERRSRSGGEDKEK